MVDHLPRKRPGRGAALEGEGPPLRVLQQVAAPHRALGRQAEHPPGRLVAEGDDVVGDHEEDSVRGLAQDGAQQPALLADLPGVGHGDRGLGAERLEQARVLLGELGAPLLVGQVEVAEDLVPHPQRHAEERPHAGVVGGEAGGARVGREVGDAQRPPLVDDRAEQPPSLWQVADARRLLVGDAHGDEVRQLGVLRVEHPHRSVPGAGQLTGLGHQQAQEAAQRVPPVLEGCGAERLHPGAGTRLHVPVAPVMEHLAPGGDGALERGPLLVGQSGGVSQGEDQQPRLAVDRESHGAGPLHLPPSERDRPGLTEQTQARRTNLLRALGGGGPEPRGGVRG
ncbi:MAG: hypothetical protein QM765_19305 [Myxococcales bacterium]